MLDCVLIYLPKPFLKNPDAQIPLGLAYIAASLRNKGKTVEIKNFASLTDEEAIKKLPLAQLYGITTTGLEIPQANRFAMKIREKIIGANIIIGGPGSYSKEFVDFNVIDSVFHGDGEITIHDVLEDAYKNQLKKEYIGETIQDLDVLPFPARDLFKNKGGDIFAYGEKYNSEESTVITSSRGCVMQCSFCSAPTMTHNNCIRTRDPFQVAREIEEVKEKYGITNFRFSDDMFCLNEKRTLALCEEIGPLNINWRISLRVKPLTENMLKALKDAGCREFSFGIENMSDSVLKILNKNATVKDNVRALELSHKYGFTTRVLHMVRTPGQTPETIEENKYWLKRIPFSIIASTAMIPLPGTDIWSNPDKYNIEILDKNLDKYNFYMYNNLGRRKIDPIFKIKDRDIDEFHQESEDFRDFIEDIGKTNKG